MDRAIDIHAHFVDLDAANVAHRAAPTVAPRFHEEADGWHVSFADGRTRTVPRGLVDPGVRTADMEAQGLSVHALSNWTWLYHYKADAQIASDLVGAQNDGMLSACAADPDRYLALIGLPLQDAKLSILEIERLVGSKAVTGVAIGTHVDGVNLDDERLWPVWEALDHYDLPALVHPVNVVGKARMEKFYLTNLVGNPLETTIAIANIVCSGLLDRFTKLKFGFVHGGGFAPYQVGRWDYGLIVRPETRAVISRKPSEYIAERMYFDSLTHDALSLQLLGTRWGWERVFLGSDYPWPMGSTIPVSALRDAGLEDAAIKAITTDTAASFLRLPADYSLSTERAPSKVA